jgi:hypothetical protein
VTRPFIEEEAERIRRAGERWQRINERVAYACLGSLITTVVFAIGKYLGAG